MALMRWYKAQRTIKRLEQSQNELRQQCHLLLAVCQTVLEFFHHASTCSDCGRSGPCEVSVDLLGEVYQSWETAAGAVKGKL